VCHVTTAGGVAAGGVFASIRGIVDHLGRRDSLDVRLLYAAPAAAADAAEWSIPNVDHRRWSYRGPAFFCYGPDLQTLLPTAGSIPRSPARAGSGSAGAGGS
jgi:hypothetical protein